MMYGTYLAYKQATSKFVEWILAHADNVPTSKKEIEYKSIIIADVCLRTGYKFSPRLHITLWGGVRGK